MVGFVLAGGASLGAIEVGMLKALYERGIAPDLIVGTSAGAVNGAYIASRPPTETTANQLAALWQRMRTLEVFPPNPITAVLGLLGEHDYLVSTQASSARSRPRRSSVSWRRPRSPSMSSPPTS